jgi:hypothetical protein
MTILTEEEMTEIQRFIDWKIAHADRLGLQLQVDDDMWKWRDLIASAPGATGASRTLDPKVNDVGPGNAFWIYLSDRQGNIVATHANRYIETEDFVREYICSHRFFGSRCPTLHYYPIRTPESIPVLRDRIDFGGGVWVHPEWRGKALSGYMSRVGRILALRHYLLDYYIGFIEATVRRRNYGHEGLGLINRRHMISGRYPGRNKDSYEVDMYWMHRGEMISQIVAEMHQEEDVEPLTMRTA